MTVIQTLDIQNFTTLPNDTWRFASGVNVVVGENGLGKTHLLKLLYALLKTHADAKELTKGTLERAYAEKLTRVFRPESLGRLVKRQQGRNRCEWQLTLQQGAHTVAGAFATNAKSQIELRQSPSAPLGKSPAYLPTRELVTLCPWFLPLYENYHLEFEETWRDTVALLGSPLLRGPKEKRVAELLKPLEEAMGGRVVVDTGTGRFYLHIPGEGNMEMPLVAEGLRKMAMLARLISSGTLLEHGYLFWDEPESNLNPKLIKVIAASIVAIAASGVQVFLATHSLFLLRELHLLLQDKRYQNLSSRWFALAVKNGTMVLEQSNQLDDIQTLVMLDEELAQSDRYLAGAPR
jgi:predicted ATPase